MRFFTAPATSSILPSVRPAALAASCLASPAASLARPSASICSLPSTLPATFLIVPPSSSAAPSPRSLSIDMLELRDRLGSWVPRRAPAHSLDRLQESLAQLGGDPEMRPEGKRDHRGAEDRRESAVAGAG